MVVLQRNRSLIGWKTSTWGSSTGCRSSPGRASSKRVTLSSSWPDGNLVPATPTQSGSSLSPSPWTVITQSCLTNAPLQTSPPTKKILVYCPSFTSYARALSYVPILCDFFSHKGSIPETKHWHGWSLYFPRSRGLHLSVEFHKKTLENLDFYLKTLWRIWFVISCGSTIFSLTY